VKSVIKNMILFKVGWAACVTSAAYDRPWIGALAIILICGEHLWTARRRTEEGVLLLAAALLGLVWESLLVSFGLLEYRTGVLHEWLCKRWEAASLAGLICGPVAFASGERIGAVNFLQNHLSLLAIGVGWAILLPLLTSVVRLLDETPSNLPANAN
jgi:signal transduction histidine kinase